MSVNATEIFARQNVIAVAAKIISSEVDATLFGNLIGAIPS